MKKKKQEKPISPYLPEEELGYYGPSGSYVTDQQYMYVTGTNNLVYFPQGNEIQSGLHLQDPRAHNLEFDIEDLWEKMYTRMLRVIVVCTHCGVPQTIDNGSCMRCGAPLPVPTRLGE